MYRCPRTGMNVPLPFSLETGNALKAETYEGVTCPACMLVHLINKSTGKLLGDGTSSAKPRG
jgi:hypothetical protein